MDKESISPKNEYHVDLGGPEDTEEHEVQGTT